MFAIGYANQHPMSTLQGQHHQKNWEKRPSPIGHCDNEEGRHSKTLKGLSQVEAHVRQCCHDWDR